MFIGTQSAKFLLLCIFFSYVKKSQYCGAYDYVREKLENEVQADKSDDKVRADRITVRRCHILYRIHKERKATEKEYSRVYDRTYYRADYYREIAIDLLKQLIHESRAKS